MFSRLRSACLIGATLAGVASPAGAALIVNEIMYNSIEDPGDVEYIEIYNTGPAAQDLTGWYVLDDTATHPKCYLSGTLPAGGYWVVAGFLDRFTAKYPWVTNLNPNPFDSAVPGAGWSLGNSNDDVRLHNAAGTLVDFVHYTDAAPWPTAPDGTGPSLELYNPALDNGYAANWGPSVNPAPHGTPGAQNSDYRVDQAPRIDVTARSVPLPTSADTVVVTSLVIDDVGLAHVDLWVDEGAGYASRAMFDDGMHGDGGIGDNLYGASIAPHADGTRVRYYVSATDTLSQETRDPATAPSEYFGYTVGWRPYQVVVNELVARNVNGIVDEAGQHEDWVELRNREPFAINLGGYYLTDSLTQPRRWRIPDGTVIPAGGYLHVWCDSDQGQGPLHTSFKLNSGGGRVALMDTADHGNTAVHLLTYGASGADVAFGYLPEDAPFPEYLATPTPAGSNAASTVFSPVCLNEFLTSSAAGGIDDWVELYNRGTVPVDIGGWRLSDHTAICGGGEDEYVIPPGTILPPGGFWVVDESTLGFGFDLEGSDLIQLANADCVVPTGQDYFDHVQEFFDTTHGRLPDGGPEWRYFSPAQVSRGSANGCVPPSPALAPVTGLAFTSRVEFGWDAVSGAEDYDVVRGSLAALRSGGGNFTAAVTRCVENDGLDRRSWDASAVPAGDGFFYLVRAMSFSCPTGTYDEGAASQQGGRDAEIDGAAGTCP